MKEEGKKKKQLIVERLSFHEDNEEKMMEKKHGKQIKYLMNFYG